MRNNYFIEIVGNSKREGFNRRKRQNDMEEDKGQILLYQPTGGKAHKGCVAGRDRVALS